MRGWQGILIGGCCCLLEALAAPAPAHADRPQTLVLRGGGRIQGRWLNPHRTPSEAYLFESTWGVQVGVPAERVREVVEPSPPSAAESEYQRLADRCPDTAEAHWQLAQWCQQQQLHDQRQFHLRQVLKYQEHHEQARHALGYRWHRGQWITPPQHNQSLGYVRQGGWRTSQEAGLIRQRAQREQAQRQWRLQLTRWSKALGGPNEASAIEAIAAIRDPQAVPAIGELLSSGSRRDIHALAIQTLGNIPCSQSTELLVNVVLYQGDVELVDKATQLLVQRRSPKMVEFFVKLLKSNNNTLVNRAGAMLGELQDAETISPLIDGLVTRHCQLRPGAEPIKQLEAASQRPTFGGDVPSFSPGTWSVGQDLEQRLAWRVAHNYQVLKALIRIAGDQGFGFDQQAWRIWHNARRNRPDPRRLRGSE